VAPILLCLVVYVRWQLGDEGADELASDMFRVVSPASVPAANDCAFGPSPGGTAPACARAAGPAPGALPAQPRWARAPGVYIDSRGGSPEHGVDATIRGARLAERIIGGGADSGELPRRGKKGALDVIVVGANVFGISATVHLMQAGLRVLLVDRQSWAPLDAATHRRLRLPLVTGHHVSVVAQRADGMLEVQAERAGWYTANVIFASEQAAAPLGEWPSAPAKPPVACAPAAPRAA
jgi:hypothetical protein